MALVLLGPLAFRPTDTAKTSYLAGSRAARPGCQRLSRTIDPPSDFPKRKLTKEKDRFFTCILSSPPSLHLFLLCSKCFPLFSLKSPLLKSEDILVWGSMRPKGEEGSTRKRPRKNRESRQVIPLSCFQLLLRACKYRLFVYFCRSRQRCKKTWREILGDQISGGRHAGEKKKMKNSR